MLHRWQGAARARLVWLLLALAATFAASAAAEAQEQEQDLTVELASFTASEPEQGQAVVTVLDGTGRPVAGLTAEQFQIRIDGSQAPVTGVTRAVDSSQGIAVVLALDVSLSMQGDTLEQAKAAARRFLEGLSPQDSVAIAAFASTVNVPPGFTQDPAAAAFGIESLSASPLGGTALYQATVDSLRLAAESGSQRQAVVLLSDGVDNNSQISRDEALSLAANAGVPVFTVGLGTEIDADYLEGLARSSGGQFVVTPSPEELTGLYQQVGELLRGQYILDLDVSALSLEGSQIATLRVDVASGGQTGSGERQVCLQQTCVVLSEVEPGERLEGERTIAAQVISAQPVVSVTFLVDGESVLELSEPPFEFTFDPEAFAEGEHTLAATATTAEGASTTTEVAVRTGAGGGVGTMVFAAGGLVLAGIAVVLLLFLRRRRRGGQERPSPVPPHGPPPGAEDRPQPEEPPQLWQEGPPAPPAAPEVPLGRLLVTEGPRKGDTFQVGAAPISIGSGHRCLVRLPEWTEQGEEIPPEEARVWVRDGQLMVHELLRLTVSGPVGGRWSILAPGEGFMIGPCSFRFELEVAEQETLVAPSPEPDTPREVPNILRDSSDQARPL